MSEKNKRDQSAIIGDEEGFRISLENDETGITYQSQDNPTMDFPLGAVCENREEFIDNEKANEFVSIVKKYASKIPKIVSMQKV